MSYEIDTTQQIKYIETRVWDSRIINHIRLLNKEGKPIMESEVYNAGGDIVKQKIP